MGVAGESIGDGLFAGAGQTRTADAHGSENVQRWRKATELRNQRDVRGSCRPKRTTWPVEATARTRSSRYHSAQWSCECLLELILNAGCVAATQQTPFSVTLRTPLRTMIPEEGGLIPQKLFAEAVGGRVLSTAGCEALPVAESYRVSSSGWGTPNLGLSATAGRGIAMRGIVFKFALICTAQSRLPNSGLCECMMRHPHSGPRVE
jgi:hypothetical protein